MYTHILVLILFATWYYFGCMEADFQKGKWKEVFQPKPVLAILMISVGMCFFANFGVTLLTPLLPEDILQNYDAMMEEARYGVRLLPSMIAILVAPLGEEFMYRGVLFYYLQQFFKNNTSEKRAFVIANSIQALLFGVFHGNLIQGTCAFLFGLLFGYMTWQFKSVIPSIMAHMTNNLLSVFVWGALLETLPVSTGVYLGAVGVSLVVVLCGLVWVKQILINS